jgi:uncharacterized membrane protein
MAAFLFLLLLAAITGVLGAVLKALALVIIAIVGGAMLLGWLGWRSLRRSLEQAPGERPLGGTTTITIGRARREDPGAGDAPTAGRDDRY